MNKRSDSAPAVPYFPLTAFAGYTVVRKALLCLLVDPTLRGLALSGPIGTGKSALARSFGAFVRAHVDPDAPLVQVPVGVGEERLLGGIDIEAALLTGRRVERPGLLAEADGGTLFVDDLPLLDEIALASIAEALERGVTTCEREGLGTVHPSRFTLVATLVPSERELPLWFADKLAFQVAQEKRLDADLVHMLLARIARYERDPERFAAEHDRAERKLAERVAAGRLLCGLMTVGPATMERLAAAAIMLGVSGNRADIFAAKAARAHAALRGSRTIEDADIAFAIATVLAPRSETHETESERPGERPTPPSAQEEHAVTQQGGGEDADEGEQESAREEPTADDGEGGNEGSDDERIHDTLDFNGELPPIEQFLSGPRRATVAGSLGERDQWQRGRHTRSLQRELAGRRIALGATLRAAASRQRSRPRDHARKIVVRREDIHVKKFTERAGTLFVFCVDASGSMAQNRMREAKGAVAELLQEAYVNRDSVALIAFRGAGPELLLPPTSSVERAKRSLDVLPTGGGTPLAGALVKAYGVVMSARRRGSDRVLVVLLTDGRANVPITESPAGMIMEVRRRHVREELDRVALAYRREGIDALVIDTRQVYGATSEAVRLAGVLGARYYYLPRIDATGLAAVVRDSNPVRQTRIR